MNCLVTGANGYVGSVVSKFLQSRSCSVTQLVRNPNKLQNGFRYLGYTLDSALDKQFLQNIDALVHCAYDFSCLSWEEIHRTNVEGSIRLLRSAKEAGIKNIVFISSVSAFGNCRSLYGQAKLTIENEAKKLGVMIIRPGLVFGEQAGGMMGSLKKLTGRLTFIPVVGGNSPMLLCHEDDLGKLVYAACCGELKDIDKPIIAASSRSYSFVEILQRLAEAQGKKPTFLKLPWQPLWLLLKLKETLGLRKGFRSDSLLSLLNPDPSPDFKPTESTAVSFRNFA